MTTDQKIKQSLIEAQIRGSGIHEDDKLLERIRVQTGYDWKHPVGDYPYDLLVQIVTILMESLVQAGKTQDEALYKLGCDTARGFRETIIGRVSLAAAPMMKPATLMTKLLTTFDSQTNYGQRRVEQVAPQHIRLILIDEPGHPAWVRGVAETLLSFGNVKDFKLEITVVNTNHKIFDIRW